METQSPSAPLIHSRMIAIMRETDAIGKDSKNQQQGFKFRGIDAVMNAMHPVFSRHGVYLTTEVLEHNHIEKTTKNGGALLHQWAKVRFSFFAEDGSSINVVTVGEAMDTADKSMNKCMSVALKYALFQMLLIPTEDDPDNDHHEPRPQQRQEQDRPPERKPATANQVAAIERIYAAHLHAIQASIAKRGYKTLADLSFDEASNLLSDSESIIAKLAAKSAPKTQEQPAHDPTNVEIRRGTISSDDVEEY